MLTRITTSMMANRSVSAINNSYNLMNKYQTQLETQSKISRPSDDPVVAMKGLKSRTELAGITQYIRNNNEAETWISATDTAYDEAKTLIQRMRELADDMANGTKTESDRLAASEELKQIREQMVEIANTQVGGKYIFNGTDIDIKPFTVEDDGTIARHQGVGSNDPLRVEVSRADGIDAMMDVNSFPNLFFVPDNSAGATGATQFGDKVVGADGKINITIDGKAVEVSVAAGDTIKKVMVKINEAAVKNGGVPIASIEAKKDANGNDTSELKLTTYTDDPAGSLVTVDMTGIQLGTPMTVSAGQNNTSTIDLNGQQILNNTTLTITGTDGKVYRADLSKGNDINAIETALKTAGGGTLPLGVTIAGTTITLATNVKAEFSSSVHIGDGTSPTCNMTQTPYDPNANPAQQGLAKPTVFDEIDSFVSLLENKGNLTETDISIELSNWLTTADQMLERANLAMAEVGGKQNRLDLIKTRNDSTELFVTDMLSKNEDIEFERVIMNLSIQESMHRAALSVGAKILQPSLVDFIS